MNRNPVNAQLVAILIMAILLVVFTLQNSVEVTITLFFWKINNVPLVLLILSCLLIGYLLPLVSFLPRIWKLKSELRKTRKENEELQEEAVSGSRETSHPEGLLFEEEDEEPNSRGFFKE